MNRTSDLPAETVVTTLDDEIRICAPGNLRGGRTSPTTARLTWDELYSTCAICPDAIGYEVSEAAITTISLTRPPCEITGLKPGTEYVFQVTAKANALNVSRPSLYRLLVMPAPSQPGTPELCDLSDASVTLFWAPSAPQWSEISYRVYLNGWLVKHVTEPLVNLAHLQSHTDYRVEVRAVNASGVSEPSLIGFKTRVRAPTNLRFSHRNGLCRLAWDPVFRKYPTHEVSINDKVFTAAPGRWGFNFKLADISPGPAPHHFSCVVVALLDAERSEAASLDHTLTDDVPPSRPGTPQVTDITDTSATLSWTPSEDNVGVTVYWVVLNGMLVYPTKETCYTFNKLISGAYYWVYVRARDKDGNLSTPGAITVFKTTGQAPSPQPMAPTARITAVTSTSALLEWEDQEGVSVTGARIMVNGEFFKDVYLFKFSSLNNLVPNLEYEISISSFDRFGQLSEPTHIVHVPTDSTLPGMPGSLRISRMTSDSVTLLWDEATDDIGICEYVIYNNHEYYDRTPLMEYSAVDLLPGTHSFEVCAMDLSGNASDPAALTVFIKGLPSDAPSNFRFTQTGWFPTLEWDATDALGEFIRYSVILTGPNGNTLDYESIATILKPVLFPRTRYKATITAITANGQSLPLMGEFTTK
jgi:chitodextrinase